MLISRDVEVIVAIPDMASHALDLTLDVEHFTNDKEQDFYICRREKTYYQWALVQQSKASGKTINRVKHYKTKVCLTCELFEKCTKKKPGDSLNAPSTWIFLMPTNNELRKTLKPTEKDRPLWSILLVL